MALGVMLPQPVLQFFDDDGEPLAGGKLYSYQAGTSTPQAIYTSAALTTPLSNPIVLDAAGRTPALFTDGVALKLVLTTATDVLLWTADQVYPSNLFVGRIQTPEAFGHAIGGSSPSDPEAVAFALVGNFTPPSTTTTATMLGVNPNPLDLSSATSIATVSLESVTGAITLPATADPALSVAGLRVTAPAMSSNGAVAAAAATLQVTNAPAQATLAWGLQVSNAPVRFRQAVVMDGILTPAQITSNQDNYNPTGLDTAFLLRLSTDASRNITGLDGVPAALGSGMRNGRLLLVKNVGAQDVVLVHESGSSSAANRFNLPGAANMTVNAGDMAFLYYDTTATRWAALGL